MADCLQTSWPIQPPHRSISHVVFVQHRKITDVCTMGYLQPCHRQVLFSIGLALLPTITAKGSAAADSVMKDERLIGRAVTAILTLAMLDRVTSFLTGVLFGSEI